MFESDLTYAEFYEILVTLTLEGETEEIALAALRLQVALTEVFGRPM